MRRPPLLGVVTPLLFMTLASGCSATDDRPFVWGYISPAIFQPTCATPSCHSRGAAVAGLDFSDPDRGYASLMEGTTWVPDPAGDPANGCRDFNGTLYCPFARPLVVPFNPSQSRVVNMLRARNAQRMPPDRPLPEGDIRLVETWILDGARKSSDTPPKPPIHEGGVPTDAGDAGADAVPADAANAS